MNIDHLFFRTYDRERYNCAHFVNEAWRYLFGLEINIPQFGDIDLKNRFKRIQKPVSPCIVIFAAKSYSHVGLFYKGKVLHIRERGVRYEPLDTAKLAFRTVRFYQ